MNSDESLRVTRSCCSLLTLCMRGERTQRKYDTHQICGGRPKKGQYLDESSRKAHFSLWGSLSTVQQWEKTLVINSARTLALFRGLWDVSVCVCVSSPPAQHDVHEKGSGRLSSDSWDSHSKKDTHTRKTLTTWNSAQKSCIFLVVLFYPALSLSVWLFWQGKRNCIKVTDSCDARASMNG